MAVYILGGARTAIGSFLGTLSQVPAPKLGAAAIEGALQKSNIEKNKVDEVFMGNVISSGVGQAPARQASLGAGIPESVPTTTVGKVCGSGLQAIILGARSIMTGDNQVVVAGGMENMSLAPHMLMNSRNGFKFGPTEMKDSMAWDGLTDAYRNVAMGVCAEECVKKYSMSREEQDAFAIESFKRAQAAAKEGVFKDEIVAVKVPAKGGTTDITEDEGPFKANFEKMPGLKPAFEKDGTITAANASTINDGAAAVVLAGDAFADKAEFKILGYASNAQNPTWFTTAPVDAINKALKKAGLSMEQIDLFEINEAFAAVTMAAMKECKIPHNKVNVFGGAVAIGHPIGASGARIMVTLMNAMKKKNAKYGCTAICIGGGEALSVIIEKIR
ncbi:thiolase family protein [Peredibacter starrii]|uniref:Thiolase family protein n=1 Tax=Peredibacter starrii TaxID=28202 RepID=A0AAX4HMQ8_9BACT|nr:thiolase family protein [Peredibacter starrii]WPU64485.1 thiolase family protein [Peredibacter starrii]